MKKKESLGAVKTLIRGYSQCYNLIPETEWMELAKKFKQIVDDESLKFDESFTKFCDSLCNISLNTMLDWKYKDVERVAVDPEIVEYIFKSVNLGVLYGYALGRLLYDPGVESGEVIL